MAQTIHVTGVTNEDFFAQHAAPGLIGLVGSGRPVDRMIRRAQRGLTAAGEHSDWAHVFLLQGRRADGHHWLIESDLDIHRRHIRLGVQENRLAKYFDESHATSLALIDLGLAPVQLERVIAAALDEVAAHTRYSLRELAGTAFAIRHARWRPRENLLARNRSFFCSAFVRHVFLAAGVDLAAGVSEKNTAPEHLAATPLARTRWLLVRQRESSSGPLARAVAKARSRLRRSAAAVRQLRKQCR